MVHRIYFPAFPKQARLGLAAGIKKESGRCYLQKKMEGDTFMSMIKITGDNFKANVLEGDKPALVEFSAPWCTYCRRISPAMKRWQNSMRIPC